MIEAVVIICGGDDVGDDELSIPSRHHVPIAIVGVLVQEPVIFFVDADGVLNHGSLAAGCRHDSVKIMNNSFTITA